MDFIYGVSLYKYQRLISPIAGKKNFKELGTMLKRVTMLKSTNDRLQIMLKIVNKFSLIPKQSNKEICELFSQFLHMFMLGWFEGECWYALNTLLRAPLTQTYSICETGVELKFGSVMDEVSQILTDSYTFGGNLGLISCLFDLLVFVNSYLLPIVHHKTIFCVAH